MWIKTYRGNLCNLAKATEVRVVPPDRDTKEYVVEAVFSVGDGHSHRVWVSKHASATEATAFVDGLSDRLLIAEPPQSLSR